VNLAKRGPARLLERAANDAAQHVAVDQVLAALGQLHEIRERIILQDLPARQQKGSRCLGCADACLMCQALSAK